MDRSAYHYRIERAINFQDCLSLVVDGADMSRYGLPYFCQTDKATTEGEKSQNRKQTYKQIKNSQPSSPNTSTNLSPVILGWKVPTRLYGAILHGQFASAYTFPAHLPGGSNVTIEVIHRTLSAYVRGDVQNGISPKRLPLVLYLQLDNTAK